MSAYTRDLKETGLHWLTLFASAGTLVCCALPILFVSLGLGATVAALTGSFPILMALSQHKAWVFGVSGGLLSLAGWLTYRPGRTCPADSRLNRLCEQTQTWNRRMYWTSVAIWSSGFIAAYLALPLRIWLGV